MFEMVLSKFSMYVTFKDELKYNRTYPEFIIKLKIKTVQSL